MNKAMKALLASALFLGAAGEAWAQEKPAPEIYQKAAKFEFGESRRDLATIEEEIRKASRDQYPAIEGRLIEMLKSSETTTDAKRFVCRYLGMVGTGKAVGELSPLLSDERLSHPARMALEVIADPSAGKALVSAMEKTQGRILAGIIGSVGARREAGAVGALTKFANDTEENVAAAALAALGQIGTVEAAKSLDDAAGKVPEAQKRNVMRAQITCADRLASAGKTKEAAGIYGKIADADAPLAQRAAAAQGLIACSDRSQAVSKIAELLESDEAKLRAAALAAFRQGKDPLRAATTEKLPTLEPAAQLALIGLLNDFPKAPARNPLLAIVQSGKDEQVRKTAIECLAVHGDVTDVPMLVKLATTAQSSVEKSAAKSALANLGKPGTDETLIGLIDSVEPPARSVVIGALSTRHSKRAIPVLVKLTSGSDQQAASEAIGALGDIGGPDELKTLVGIILSGGGNDNLRNAAERAAGNLCARLSDPQATSRVLVPAYHEAKSAPAKVALLKLMPRGRGEQALAAVTSATKETDATVREAAVRVLVSWPEASAIPVLFEFLDKNDNPTHRILALQGVTRLAGQRELGNEKRVAALKQVLEKATRSDEKKAAIAALGDVRSLAAVELLGTYADDETLVSDAAQAAVRATRELRGNDREKAEDVLDAFKSKPVSDELKKRIDEVQNQEGGRRRR